MKKTLWFAAFLLLFITLPAHAQRDGVSISITGQGGALLPVTDRIEELVEFVPGTAEETTISQSTAFAFGGKVTVWVTDVFGVEGGFSYALSDAELEVGGEDVCDILADLEGEGICDANAWYGNVKGVYRWVPMPDANWALHFGGGVALIGHGGDFWDGVDGTTDVGGVLAAGLTVDITPQFAICVDVEDYLFSAGFEVDDPDLGVIETDSKFQNDLLIMGGFKINLSGAGM